MATGEVFVRMRGDGMVAVLNLIKRRRLKFEVSPSKHHGANIEQSALGKLAEYPVLRDALVYATAWGIRVQFRHGHTHEIRVYERLIILGIEYDSAEAAKLIAGPEFEQTTLPFLMWWRERLIASFKKFRRAYSAH